MRGLIHVMAYPYFKQGHARLEADMTRPEHAMINMRQVKYAQAADYEPGDLKNSVTKVYFIDGSCLVIHMSFPSFQKFIMDA